MSIEWLENYAGPLILIPTSLLPEWSGIDVPEDRTVSAVSRWNLDEARACDYDRACDVEDYVAPIPIAYGEALVLNDEPCQTAWLPRAWGGVFVRWEYAEGDQAMERALLAIPQDLRWDPKGELRIVGSPQELFNSAEPGPEPVRPRMEIALAEGRYDIHWTRYGPDRATSAGLIALRRQGA
jgi:hypothetical protein